MARSEGRDGLDSSFSSKAQEINDSPHGLLKALGSDQALTARQRVILIKQMNGSVNEDERQAAYTFLSAPEPPEGMAKSQWRWMVDELITLLRDDGIDNAELSKQLDSMYQNAGQDIVVRDYALQHLGHLREDGGDLEVIESALYAASQQNSPLAGTALLSLVQNGSINDAQQRETITRLALQAANDPEMNLASRISAMQVAGRWNDPAALTLASEIASSETTPIPLRLAAIATIGTSGKVNNYRSLLQNLSGSDDLRLKQVAQAALKTAK